MPEARPLPDAEQIRHHALVLAREPAAGATESGVDLVGDQQPALRDRTSSRSAARKPRGGMRSPPRPWIGSTSTAPIGTRARARRAPHVVGVAEAREDASRPASRAANGCAEVAAPGRVERAEREPVIGALERDDARRARSRAARSSARSRPRPNPEEPSTPRAGPPPGKRRASARAARPSRPTGARRPCRAAAARPARAAPRRRAGARAPRSRRRSRRQIDVAIAVGVPDVRALRRAPRRSASRARGR